MQHRLLPGTFVRYWSAEEGYTGGAFRIDDVSGSVIIVPVGQADRMRIISKAEFRRIFRSWQTYKVGDIERKELLSRSDNAPYIISILHWYDETESMSGPAPLIAPDRLLPQPPTAPLAVVGGNEEYGRQAIHEATEGRAVFLGPSVQIDYGAGAARVSATVGDIAIQIGVGAPERVRCAVLDLICHPHPKKLILLLPEQIPSLQVVMEQCHNILQRFCPHDSFQVLLLKGGSNNSRLLEDTALIGGSLAHLRSV